MYVYFSNLCDCFFLTPHGASYRLDATRVGAIDLTPAPVWMHFSSRFKSCTRTQATSCSMFSKNLDQVQGILLVESFVGAPHGMVYYNRTVRSCILLCGKTRDRFVFSHSSSFFAIPVLCEAIPVVGPSEYPPPPGQASARCPPPSSDVAFPEGIPPTPGLLFLRRRPFYSSDTLNMAEDTTTRLVAAGIASWIAETVTLPTDVIKVRLQVQGGAGGMQVSKPVSSKPVYTGMMDCGTKIATREGVPALWKGYAPAILRQVSYTSLTMVLYEPIRDALIGKDQPLTFGNRLLAGGTAGGLSIAVFNPFEVVKTKVQTDVRPRGIGEVGGANGEGRQTDLYGRRGSGR